MSVQEASWCPNSSSAVQQAETGHQQSHQLVHFAGNTNLNQFPACGDAVYLYPSSTVTDDLLWAASWMYAATTTNSYLTDAVGFYQSFMTTNQDGAACLPLTHVHLAVILHCQEHAQGHAQGHALQMHCI